MVSIVKSIKITIAVILTVVLIIPGTMFYIFMDEKVDADSGKDISGKKSSKVNAVVEDSDNYFYGYTYSKTEAIIVDNSEEKEKKSFKKYTKIWALDKEWTKDRLKKAKSMSLRELERNGYIDELCKEYGMSKTWFDRISTTESGYGVNIPYGTYNAWGWGVYGKKAAKLGDNWYESSRYFIKSFAQKYGHSPSRRAMKRYCPSGAYDKYF